MNANTQETTSPDTLEQLERLIEIMRQLRDPETGCPWDVEQTFSTIAPYTIEEAYEVADAIQRNDSKDICDELGDLLLQVVFQSRIAEEAGHSRSQMLRGALTNGIQTSTCVCRRRPPRCDRTISQEDLKVERAKRGQTGILMMSRQDVPDADHSSCKTRTRWFLTEPYRPCDRQDERGVGRVAQKW